MSLNENALEIIRKGTHPNPNPLRRPSPFQNRLNYKLGATTEYVPRFNKQIKPARQAGNSEDIKDLNKVEPEGLKNKLVRLNEYKSYFGFEVSVINLRPKTQLESRRASSKSNPHQ